MKKNFTLALLVLLPFCLLSNSYHTIAIDGNASGWAADETFDNISHDGYIGVKHANFTWDADYIYMAAQDNEADIGNMATFIYFDVDPYETLGTTNAYANRTSGQAIPHYYGFLLEDHVSLDSIPYYDVS